MKPIKEISYACPLCGQTLIEHQTSLLCMNCQRFFSPNKLTCPYCLQPYSTLYYDAFRDYHYAFCPNCIVLANFYFCSYYCDCSCILDSERVCNGIGVRFSETSHAIYRNNLDCDVFLISVFRYTFLQSGKVMPENELLDLLKYLIQTKEMWPSDIRMVLVQK